jgi:hypothetical protein
VIWGIEGTIEGHAGARVSVDLGPFREPIDDTLLGAVRIGIASMLAGQGQTVVSDSLTLNKSIGRGLIEDLGQLSRLLLPADALRATEETYARLESRMRGTRHPKETPNA